MEMLVRAAVVLSPFLFCNAFLNLTGRPEMEGVWKASTTLPCVYVPVKDLVQEILKWMVVRDQSSATMFRRDDSGDHVLLSDYRGRVSVLKDAPGNVSLHILNLEVSDKGTYICQVTWRNSSDSLIVREITTDLKIVKVPATKPIIRAGTLGLTVPAGARTSLTCVASGSPPISYRWFRGTPGQKALLLSRQAELVWDRLQPSDTGKYYCEVENRAGAGAVQQSDAVELTVMGSPITQQPTPGTGQHTRPLFTPRGNAPQPVTTGLTAAKKLSEGVSEEPPAATGPPAARYALPAALAAVLGAAALGALLIAPRCRRRNEEELLYEVAFHSTADGTRPETDGEVPVKCPQKDTKSKTGTSNDTFTVKDNGLDSIHMRKNPEYENLINAMELEYETERI